VWLRTGATRDGRLVAVRGRILIDGGAFASSSPAVIGNATTFLAGPYSVPNAFLQGTAVYTNNPPCGAMRGFGAPQVCFAHEANLDRLARELGLDPVELRLRNVLERGSVLPTGQVIRGSAPAREVLERCRDLPLPPEPEPAPLRDPLTFPGGAGNVGHGEGLRRGVGFALGYKNVAYSEGFDDFHQARVTLFAGPGGPVAEIHTAGVECGQGFSTVVTQVAREELGVRDVVLHAADTGVDSAGSTSASRQTFMGGGAVQMACRAAAEEVFARALARLQPEGRLGLADGEVLADGVPIAELADLLDEPVVATRTFHHRPTTSLDEHGQGEPHVMFAFGAQRAVVEVDVELGLIRVIQLASVLDVGRALNPQGVEGQSEGGSAQGLGLAVMEEVQLREGRIANASFTDYLIPTLLDMPPVVTALVEDPEPDVPYGAKGIGEVSTIVSTAAIVAAIRDATGLELNRAPVHPDDIVGLRPPAARDAWPPVPDVPGPRPVPEYHGAKTGQSDLKPKG
jgi:CO/xanthine dehydrogenase Mo-binding subunit